MNLLDVKVATPVLGVVVADMVWEDVPTCHVRLTVAPLTSVLVPARLTVTFAVHLKPLPLLVRVGGAGEMAIVGSGAGLRHKQQTCVQKLSAKHCCL